MLVPVPGRRDEIETEMHAMIRDVLGAFDLRLLREIIEIFAIDEVDDRIPTAEQSSHSRKSRPFGIVDQIAEPGRVHKCEIQSHATLDKTHCAHVDVQGRGGSATLASRIVDLREEQRVDEGRLAQTGLACKSRSRRLAKETVAPTTINVNSKPRFIARRNT